MSSQSGIPEEQPLDPALIRIQKRLRRLMIFGISTLGIGVAAVLIAIIYRFYIVDSSDVGVAIEQIRLTGEITAESVGLGPDAVLVQQTVDGNQMVLTFQDGADTVTVIVNTTTMTVARQFRITGDPVASC